MKKTLKELLWFVIPTVLIVAVYVVIYTLAASQINMPKWFGMEEYLGLYLESHIYERIMFNTTLYCFLPAFVVATVLFIVQLFVKMKRPLYYGIMATVATLANLCFKLFYFGYLKSTYPADTIIVKPEEITAIDTLKTITLYDVLQSLMIATITCFVFWTVEQLIKVLRPRVSK